MSVAEIAATDILLQKFAYQGLFIGVVLINYSVTMSNPLFGWSLDVVTKRFFCCLPATLYISRGAQKVGSSARHLSEKHDIEIRKRKFTVQKHKKIRCQTAKKLSKSVILLANIQEIFHF